MYSCILHDSSMSCEGHLESILRLSHPLIRELIKEFSPNQATSLLFFEKYINRLCIVAVNNERNILKAVLKISHLQIRDSIRDNALNRLFLIPFPLKMYRYIMHDSSITCEACLESIFRFRIC